MTLRWCPAVLRPEGLACTRPFGHDRLIDIDGFFYDHGHHDHYFNDPFDTADPSVENTPALRRKDR